MREALILFGAVMILHILTNTIGVYLYCWIVGAKHIYTDAEKQYRVRIYMSPAVKSTGIVGAMRVIFISCTVNPETPEHKALLYHELSHIKHGDHIIRMLFVAIRDSVALGVLCFITDIWTALFLSAFFLTGKAFFDYMKSRLIHSQEFRADREAVDIDPEVGIYPMTQAVVDSRCSARIDGYPSPHERTMKLVQYRLRQGEDQARKEKEESI